jgi:hypothetical protein
VCKAHGVSKRRYKELMKILEKHKMKPKRKGKR